MYLCIVARSIPPKRRTSSVLCSRISSHVRCTMRPDAGLAHEHVVGFLREHEPAGARQRVEPALGEARQLVLAVAVGEVAEHEVREPVRRPLVESAEDARLVPIARAPLQQRLGLLAAVAPEVGVEQVHHGPEMPPLLDVDLEQVAEIVERRAGTAEMALLLDRCRLRVALRDDEPAERASILARDVRPGREALVIAEPDDAPWLRLREEDAPSIVGHPHVVELGPSLRVDADGRAEIDVLASGSPRAPCRSTTRGTAAAIPRARAGAAGSPTDRRCSECARDSRCRPSRSPPIEFCSFARAVQAQRAPRSDRVRSLEDPILPCRQPREDLALERFRAGEPERGLHARERVG